MRFKQRTFYIVTLGWALGFRRVNGLGNGRGWLFGVGRIAWISNVRC